MYIDDNMHVSFVVTHYFRPFFALFSLSLLSLRRVVVYYGSKQAWHGAMSAPKK